MNARKLNDRTKVSVDFFTDRIASRPWQNYEELLVVKVDCAGEVESHDIVYIVGMLRAAKEIFSPMGVIIDFSSCNYQWGDWMTWAFSVFVERGGELEAIFGGNPVKEVAIVSEINRKAFESLLRMEMNKDPQMYLRDNYEEALSLLLERMEKQ